MHNNIEIKARSSNQQAIRDLLKAHQANFKGIDHQIDTYFKVNQGRLKLREGNIENSLIHYYRENQAGPKLSKVSLYQTSPGAGLKAVLSEALGILVVVDKQREIYFIDNVKFHIDRVKDLGAFIEIEAIDSDGTRSKEDLQQQCEYYLALFGIREEELVEDSYSDLLAGLQSTKN
ncbi:MAG: class IV adenylate cyclase [Bacteroidota bacterium]